MSNQAAIRYNAMAEYNGYASNTIPDILNGEPVPLIPPETSPDLTQVHRGKNADKVIPSLVGSYTGILESVGTFSVISACEPGAIGSEATPELNQRSRKHLAAVGELLMPDMTGIFSDYTMQAVDPHEAMISQEIVKRVIGTAGVGLNRGNLSDMLKTYLFFLTRANIRRPSLKNPTSSRIFGKIAFLTAVHAEDTSIIYQARSFTSGEINGNKALEKAITANNPSE